MKVDIGKLTSEETADLMRQCIEALSEDELFRVLNETLTAEQRGELGESWFDVDREG